MSLDALLSTKVCIPAARAKPVARPRLLAGMTEGLRLGRRLTLVCAPAGFGKTTLMREWVDAAGRPAAWLTVDEDDNDPDRFLSYVTAALHKTDAAIGVTPSPTTAPRAGLIELINDLAATGTELLLILDDYHLIVNYAVHDLVAFLLANQPCGLHVVIGTREDPPLPLARMRARDQLTEVREQALRFRTDEAAAFLNQTMALDVPAEAVQSLARRTEGWIAGLQLAGLALRQQSATDEFVAAFAGDEHYILDYLMAEVLARETEPVRSFLRETSILDRLCAPLCDAVTARDDAAAMLEHLTSVNLFLVPLDSCHEWYRYHVLFAEILALTLNPQHRGELHQRAAAWCEAQGLGDMARRQRQLAMQFAPPTVVPTAARRQPLIEPLSERELEVLRLIAAGYSNAEIGARLYIAVGTVKRHINNINGKLEVSSRTQAIAKAHALRLID
jgi:LuxR family transcriptional regulator, maltose regulon positive regulatory protein